MNVNIPHKSGNGFRKDIKLVYYMLQNSLQRQYMDPSTMISSPWQRCIRALLPLKLGGVLKWIPKGKMLGQGKQMET